MYLAEITFPSGNLFKVGTSSLSTAMYFARKFGCNVIITTDCVPSQELVEYTYREEWED